MDSVVLSPAVEQDTRVKSGSGAVDVRRADRGLSISTGSGGVALGGTRGVTTVKTGSGSLAVTAAHTDLTHTTGSGDLAVGAISAGRLQAKGASGDVRVGVPAGVAVWTDISTASGRIDSSLESSGPPQDGADHVELRVKTASGDVVLAHS